jgi:hypothetical protein
MTTRSDKPDGATLLTTLPPDDAFRIEAERLANLSARHRKAALAVHLQIADNSTKSQTTRDYARHVFETLDAMVKHILKTRK